MKEIFDIFSGEPKNDPIWMGAVEGLSKARERMEQLAGKKPGEYFLFSVGTNSILAQTETFRQPQRVMKSNNQSGGA